MPEVLIYLSIYLSIYLLFKLASECLDAIFRIMRKFVSAHFGLLNKKQTNRIYVLEKKE